MNVTRRWQYYISSFMRNEPTEGVSRARMQKSLLARNLVDIDTDAIAPSKGDDSDYPHSGLIAASSQGLASSICMHSYKMLWKPNTTEWFIINRKVRDRAIAAAAVTSRNSGRNPSTVTLQAEEMEEIRRNSTAIRSVRLRKNFILNSKWMKNMAQDQVQKAKNAFEKLAAHEPKTDGVAESLGGDVEMTV